MKVGDRVQVTTIWSQLVGERGTIVRLCESFRGFSVKLDGIDDPLWFDEDEIAPA